MTVEELFGTLQQSVVASWRKHLKTDKYSKHEALDEFYKEMPELVDKLIEDWMGVNGKVEGYKNLLDNSAEMTAIEYLQQLKKIVKDGYELMGEKELEADLDSIASQIDSTLYKLKELDESMSLSDYLKESLNENKKCIACDKETINKVMQELEDEGSDISIIRDILSDNYKDLDSLIRKPNKLLMKFILGINPNPGKQVDVEGYINAAKKAWNQ